MTTRPMHGGFIRLEDLVSPDSDRTKRFKVRFEVATGRTATGNLNAYDYLFKGLVATPENLLDNTPEVIKALKDLGAAMKENPHGLESDSELPAAYTYLGQFIDHDISRDAASDDITKAPFHALCFEPIHPDRLNTELKNVRSGTFDLDSVYEGDPPLENGMFKIGEVSYALPQIANKDIANDLPRMCDGSKKAAIGDSRNDENTIIAQLHVAMLKFHNAVMQKRNCGFVEARRIVRQHYQWIVLHDFLKKICDAEIVDEILTKGNKFYKPTADNFFMPVEFSAAAYRFGHSMVREVYNFNQAHDATNLAQLFRFSGSSGDLGGMPTLQRDWIIEWERFLPFGRDNYNKARRIDTRLSSALHQLTGPGIGIFQILAKINLLRGYLLSLPTGQAVARAILKEENVLTEEQILNNATAEERAALASAGLHIKTPLWYYVLAEASIQHGGAHLGKLGSTIVAETIIGLMHLSADSILKEEHWEPVLGAGFNLEQLIIFADLGPVWAE
ncbi:peroxidase family protein [Dyadobacter endophyticus]|uniref:peroxidase family protein n=1 Tax=Dyadobacter endophyticus TaxID=1749036 RepID=UPI003CF3B6D2